MKQIIFVFALILQSLVFAAENKVDETSKPEKAVETSPPKIIEKSAEALPPKAAEKPTDAQTAEKNPEKNPETKTTKESEKTVDKNKIRVAYFGRVSEQDFNEKIKPVFNETAQCKNCEIVNWTPYDSNQHYDDSKLMDKVLQIENNAQIVFFDWNDKSTSRSEALINELQKLRGRQQFLVASAGIPNTDDRTCPLNQTLFGKVEDAIIVGELIQRDILWPRCFFGPEMLTAVRPPREYMGKGVGSLIFVAKFAGHFTKRKPDEWIGYLRGKKAKSRRIWPEIEEFFPR
jgi:hypothetical protein